jgi:hypothetical protein
MWVSCDFDDAQSQTLSPADGIWLAEVHEALAIESEPYREAFFVVNGLLKPDTPAELAAKHGISRQQVYNRAKQVALRLRRRFA